MCDNGDKECFIHKCDYIIDVLWNITGVTFDQPKSECHKHPHQTACVDLTCYNVIHCNYYSRCCRLAWGCTKYKPSILNGMDHGVLTWWLYQLWIRSIDLFHFWPAQRPVKSNSMAGETGGRKDGQSTQSKTNLTDSRGKMDTINCVTHFLKLIHATVIC